MIALLIPLAFNNLQAQDYSTGDTVTEYPNKGTFYHDLFEGRKTASGEIFDQNKFTAAHWKIKLGTYVMVTNCNSGKQVIVRVNDRCPKRGVFDMSHRAATAIGIRGCQPVTIRILPEGYEERWAAQETMFDSVSSRLTGGQLAKEPSQVAPTPKEKIPIFEDDNTTSQHYRLKLGTAPTHSEAYTMVNRLPDAYRQKVSIEQTATDDSLDVYLATRLSKQHAEQLAAALKSQFPGLRILLSE